MGINGIASGYYPEAYNAGRVQKTETNKSFAKSMSEVIEESGVGSIGSVNESGDTVVWTCCDNVNGLLTTVYKTPDFDPANPVYKVKTWGTDGNVTERMIDVSKIDTKNCDAYEMFAYISYLKDSGKGDYRETTSEFSLVWAIKNIGPDGLPRQCDYSEKVNWVEVVQQIMQFQYDVGNLAGYMEFKKFLDLLGE